MNIVHHLNKRSISPWNWNIEVTLSKSLTCRCVKLSSILSQTNLLQGHVVLGFTRSGDGLISYNCRVDSSLYYYTVFWWKFNIYKQITLIKTMEIFQKEEIDCPLRISLYDDGTWIYILGYRNQTVLEMRPCYLSVTSSWPTVKCKTIFHYKFELFLKNPLVQICFGHSPFYYDGALFINTGVAIVCIKCQLHQKLNSCSLDDNSLPVICSELNGDKEFVAEETSIVDLYNKPQIMESTDCATMVHIILDVDSWIAATIPKLLSDDHLIYQCICDYHLDLIQIHTDYSVTILIWTIIQLASQDTLQYIKRHVLIVATWDIKSSTVKLKEKYDFSNSNDSCKWRAHLFKKKYSLEQLHSPLLEVRELSNKSVFSGDSLLELHHPYIPLVIVL